MIKIDLRYIAHNMFYIVKRFEVHYMFNGEVEIDVMQILEIITKLRKKYNFLDMYDAYTFVDNEVIKKMTVDELEKFIEELSEVVIKIDRIKCFK